MSSWMPEDLSRKGLEGAGGLFEREVAAESAATLGRAGGVVERRLAELRAFQGAAADRDALVKAAADAVYAYVVQREAIGLVDHREAIARYGIPNEVLVRLGGR